MGARYTVTLEVRDGGCATQTIVTVETSIWQFSEASVDTVDWVLKKALKRLRGQIALGLLVPDVEGGA
jgi:hypothetical protein